MNEPKSKAVLKRLKDPLYDVSLGRPGDRVLYFADGRVIPQHWEGGKTVVERGRCWTCKWCWQHYDDDLECEAPNVPEGDEDPTEQGCDCDAPPCPRWEGDIGTCEKHGEYLEKHECIECAMEEHKCTS